MPQTDAVAAGHPLTVQAAEIALNAGGNAFDAALAALFMSFVCEPLLSSPGGGGFLLAAPREGEATLFDFFSNTPFLPAPDSGLDFYPIDGDFGPTRQQFHIGHGASAVPGVPAGIHAVHGRLGSRPLHALAAPAIEAARTGVRINRQQAHVGDILKPVIGASDSARTLFSDYRMDATWRNPQLADFLEQLSDRPAAWFYRDDPMHHACRLAAQHGGLLREEDFSAYACMQRTPLKHRSGSATILSNGGPSTGGRLIIAQLQHAEKHHPHPDWLIDAMLHADRCKRDEGFVVKRGTTHISVADAQGNLAALTVSNGEGNGHVLPGGGFMLNNFLGEEDINPRGFFSGAPGQRMASMMAPTVILDGETRWALGAGGSNRIKTALFQVIWHLLRDRWTLARAIAHPRMHCENGHLDCEPGLDSERLSGWLKKVDSHTLWKAQSLYFGGVNAVQSGPTVSAIGDARRRGCGLVNCRV